MTITKGKLLHKITATDLDAEVYVVVGNSSEALPIKAAVIGPSDVTDTEGKPLPPNAILLVAE